IENYRTCEGVDARTGRRQRRSSSGGGGSNSGGGGGVSNPTRRNYAPPPRAPPPAPPTGTGTASITAVQGERTFQTEAGAWAGAGEGSGVVFSSSSFSSAAVAAGEGGAGGKALEGGQHPLSPMPRILPNAFRTSPQEAAATAASAGEGGSGGGGGIPEAFALARERAKELRPLGSARAAAELGGLLRQA
ncbi:unnamed protein product, partial [Ectocarpus fasciculatus]